jgi:hypothetical protein
MLKQLVADLSLDREALKAVIRKNGWSLLGYEKPREFAASQGYGDVESKERFPHPNIPTALTTATTGYIHLQTKTGKLQLWLDEKNGEGNISIESIF